jgi:hypothetical protein
VIAKQIAEVAIDLIGREDANQRNGFYMRKRRRPADQDAKKRAKLHWEDSTSFFRLRSGSCAPPASPARMPFSRGRSSCARARSRISRARILLLRRPEIPNLCGVPQSLLRRSSLQIPPPALSMPVDFPQISMESLLATRGGCWRPLTSHGGGAPARC